MAPIIYDKKIFAHNLTFFMNKCGYKQADIAALLNVTKGAVSSWCSGMYIPRVDKIECLANLFDIKKSDLLEKRADTLSQQSPDRLAMIELVNSLPDEQVSKLLAVAKAVLGQ